MLIRMLISFLALLFCQASLAIENFVSDPTTLYPPGCACRDVEARVEAL